MQGKNLMLDCIVLKGSGGDKVDPSLSSRKVLHVQSISPWAPTCIGPYSQCNTLHNSIMYLSGNIPLKPETMTKLPNATLADKTRLTWRHVARVLDALDQGNLTHMALGIVYIDEVTAASKIYSESFNEYDAICRDQIRTNAGEKMVDQIIQVTEDEVETREFTSCVDVPLLYVVMPALPRACACEIETILLTRKAQNLFARSFINKTVQNKEEDSMTHVQATVVESSVCIALVSHSQSETEASSDHLNSTTDKIVHHIVELLLESKNHWDSMIHLRMFFVDSLVLESDLEVALRSSLSNCVGEHLKNNPEARITMPAITFVPVVDIRTTEHSSSALRTTVAAQATCHNLDRMESQLWLQKAI